MKTTIKTNTKEMTIKANKEKLFGFAIGYNKEYNQLCIVLPFLVIEIKTKLLIDLEATI
tara:strand:- start:430 stop:606 length:177 start_codon:yes stop_codon:yes gene_type:complete